MTEWQDISGAPKDGRLIITYWSKRFPVLVAWFDDVPRQKTTYSGKWPFRKKHIQKTNESGWRVVMPCRDGCYGIHGNYAPFTPDCWHPFPGPPPKDIS